MKTLDNTTVAVIDSKKDKLIRNNLFSKRHKEYYNSLEYSHFKTAHDHYSLTVNQ